MLRAALICYTGCVMQKRRASLDAIRSFRGIFKRQPGEKSATQELLIDRAEGLRLEEAKWKRFEKKLKKRGGEKR